jgi:hypothetical protein
VASETACDLETYRETDGTSIDLQWTLARPEWRIPLDLAELWPRLETTVIDGRIVPMPTPDDCLRFLCAHGAKHCWCALKWIADVALLVTRHQARIDWPRLLESVRDHGGLRQLLLGLRLAHDVLGSSVPSVASAWIERDPAVIRLANELRGRLFTVADPGTHQGSYGYLEGGWLYARTRERIRDRVPLLLDMARHIITPTERDRAVIALPAGLVWGYYVLRPFRLAARWGTRRPRG